MVRTGWLDALETFKLRAMRLVLCLKLISMTCGALIAINIALPAQARSASTSSAAESASLIADAYELYQQGRFAVAARMYERLAHAGDRVAQFDLAVMHAKNEAPHARTSTALALLRSSAAQRFPPAMRALGETYERGTLGVRRDLYASTLWFVRAAEAGDVEAALSAGTAYYLGRGAPKDFGRAAEFFLQAASGGDAGAQYLYASMAESGDGMAQDLSLARYWYDAAARNGEAGAVIKVQELDMKLRQSH